MSIYEEMSHYELCMKLKDRDYDIELYKKHTEQLQKEVNRTRSTLREATDEARTLLRTLQSVVKPLGHEPVKLNPMEGED